MKYFILELKVNVSFNHCINKLLDHIFSQKHNLGVQVSGMTSPQKRRIFHYIYDFMNIWLCFQLWLIKPIKFAYESVLMEAEERNPLLRRLSTKVTTESRYCHTVPHLAAHHVYSLFLTSSVCVCVFAERRTAQQETSTRLLPIWILPPWVRVSHYAGVILCEGRWALRDMDSCLFLCLFSNCIFGVFRRFHCPSVSRYPQVSTDRWHPSFL